jgi:hypothetical protein
MLVLMLAYRNGIHQSDSTNYYLLRVDTHFPLISIVLCSISSWLGADEHCYMCCLACVLVLIVSILVVVA